MKGVQQAPINTLKGTGCGADKTKTYCDGEGNCVGCDKDDDCVLDKECPTWKCVETPGGSEVAKQCEFIAVPEGIPKQTVGDCQTLSCAGGSLKVTLETKDVPEQPPENPCMVWTCNAPGTVDEVADKGKACGEPKTCTGVVAKAEDTCDGDGVCQSGAEDDCLPYACDTATNECKKTCTPATQDQDCVDGYCEGNLCKPKIETGMPCMAGAQCITGFCADGVCCNNACDTACNTCALGGATAGTCSALPKGVVDTCNVGQACNGGACVSLGTKKAIGTACTQESDCFHDSANMTNCFAGLCRLDVGTPCEQATFWYCSTKFCNATGVCAECATNADCGPGGACVNDNPMNPNSTKRCLLGPGAPCGATNDCALGLTCNVASGSPGTCQ